MPAVPESSVVAPPKPDPLGTIPAVTSPTVDPRLRQLIDDYFGVHVSDILETAGEHGASGGKVHYFGASIDGAATRFVVKNATQLERRIVDLLQEQVKRFRSRRVLRVRPAGTG